jgi:hypothetical protein
MGSSSFQTYGSSVAKSKIISPHFAPRNYDVSGQSTDGYQVYTFTSTTKNYQSISYNLKEPKTLSIMVVGGGGNGGLKFAGGGGGGGFLQKTIILPIGNDTININIGNGNSTISTSQIDREGSGESSYVLFDNNQALNLIAGGGGNGSLYAYKCGNGSINGGSGGVVLFTQQTGKESPTILMVISPIMAGMGNLNIIAPRQMVLTQGGAVALQL